MSALPVTVLLTGPTAAGKTAIALEFCRSNPHVEIINADSLLFYRGADIGTAKPSREEQAWVTHHLIDIRKPSERLTAGDFRRLALEAVVEIETRGKRALIVGGSGFYLKALRHGIWDAPASEPEVRAALDRLTNEQLRTELRQVDTESADRIGSEDRYRLVRALEIIRLSGKTPTALRAEENPEPDSRFPLWVADRADFEIDLRIHQRTHGMLHSGLIDEVKRLSAEAASGLAAASATVSLRGHNSVLGAVGYAQVVDYLRGEKPKGRKIPEGLPGLQSEIELATRQLVRSQRTWFRRQPARADYLLDRDRKRLLSDLARVYSSARWQSVRVE